jgi:hypothetical protein
MAKNNHDEEKYIISADGQIHAFPEEGLSNDFVDAQQEKAIEFRRNARCEEQSAKEEKKRAAEVYQTKLRQLHYAQVVALIESARVASLRFPGAVVVAMDSLDNPKIIRGFNLSFFHLTDSVFYAVFLGGNTISIGDAEAEDNKLITTPFDEVEEGAA